MAQLLHTRNKFREIAPPELSDEALDLIIKSNNFDEYEITNTICKLFGMNLREIA